MTNLQHFVANYVDDFTGLDVATRAWDSYTTMGNLLRDLGVGESYDKAVPPTTCIEFLGVWYDFINMTISVTAERMSEFVELLSHWHEGMWFTRKQLESLIGKMQFVSNCVRPVRIFVFRLHNKLRYMDRNRAQVDNTMSQHLDWWRRFLPKYNRVSLLWMKQELKHDWFLSSDSCLTGFGACHKKEYIHGRYPKNILESKLYKIHHLEMLAIILALKVWKQSLKGY